MVNTLNITDPAGLTTQVHKLQKTKYFPLEVHAVGLLPLTNYNALFNGANINAFCKPYGGNLGAQLKSDATGKLTFMYLMAIPYLQSFLVNNNTTNAPGTSLSTTSKAVIQLVAPNGITSTTFIPINLKM